MIADPNRKLPPCSRCHGKMILDKATGDSTCFTCGGTVYAVDPATLEKARQSSHAGQNLS